MAQAADLLAAEAGERHRTVVVVIDLCRARNYADTVAGAPGCPVQAGFLRPQLAVRSA